MLFKPFLVALCLTILLFSPISGLFAANNDCCPECPKKEKETCKCCGRSGKDGKGPYQQCVINKTGRAECIDPGLVPCGNPGQPACTICDTFVLVQNIIHFIMTDIIPPVASLMAAIAGLLFLFSRGKPAKRSQALKLLRNIVIGVVIAYGSFVIINSVLAFVAPGDVEKYFSLTEYGFRIECK